MNRIISINLGGYALSIEEDAYDLLRNYLRKLEAHFASNPNGREIVSDIEARLAEMFSERLQAGKSFVSGLDVEEVIAQMGNPSELNDEESFSEGSTHIRKKLFRDTEEGILGGVCSGLSIYFQIDVVWIRVIWLVLFFFGGIGFIPYLLLWIIIPAARNKADRLAMEGKSPNLKNFQESFVDEAGRVADQWRNRSRRNHWGQRIRSFTRALAQLFKGMFRLLAGIIGMALIVAGIALLFGLTFGKIYAETNVMPFRQLPALLGLESWSWLMQLSLALVLLIPLIAAVVGISRFLVGTRTLPMMVRRGMAVLWIFALLSLGSLLAYTALQFSNTERISKRNILDASDTLQVMVSDLGELDKKGLSNLRFGNVRLDVELADDGQLALWVEKQSKGPKTVTALELAGTIADGYEYNNGRLTISSALLAPHATPFRKQEIRYVLKIPEGQYVVLNKSCEPIIGKAQNVEHLWSRELVGHSLIMQKMGLACLDCSENSGDGLTGSFSKVEVEGAFKVHLRQGDEASFELRSEEYAEEIEHRIHDGRLLIGYSNGLNWKERLGVLSKPPEIYITMTEIESFRFAGANEVELSNLSSEVLNIEMEGASSLRANNLNIKVLDVSVEGAGEIEVSGKADKLLLKQEGAADVDASELMVKEAILDLNGGSKCRLNVSERLGGQASGAASVRYRGTPELGLNTSGAVHLQQDN